MLLLVAMCYEQCGGGMETFIEWRIYFSLEITGWCVGEVKVEFDIFMELVAKVWLDVVYLMYFVDL